MPVAYSFELGAIRKAILKKAFRNLDVKKCEKWDQVYS